MILDLNDLQIYRIAETWETVVSNMTDEFYEDVVTMIDESWYAHVGLLTNMGNAPIDTINDLLKSEDIRSKCENIYMERRNH